MFLRGGECYVPCFRIIKNREIIMTWVLEGHKLILVNVTMLVMELLMLRPRARPRINLEFRKLVSGITKRGISRIGPKK